MYKTKRFWIGVIITVVSLVLAFQGIQLNELWDAFGQLNPLWLPILSLAFLASYAGRVFRWQTLFYPYRVRWVRVLSTLSVGYFLSNITPLRIGDFVRAYLIGRLEQIPVAHALSTVVVERTLDGLTVVLLLIMMLPIVPNLPPEARSGGMVLGVAGLGLLIAVALLSFQRERGIALLKRLASPFPFLQRESLWDFIGNLIQGFSVVREPRPLISAILWSFQVWVFAVIFTWVTLYAMGISVPIPAAVLVQVLTALAVTVAPSAGQLGVFHLTALFTLNTLFGVNREQALAFAFVLHGVTYLWLTGLGIFFAWRDGLDLARLQDVGMGGAGMASASSNGAQAPLDTAVGGASRISGQPNGSAQTAEFGTTGQSKNQA